MAKLENRASFARFNMAVLSARSAYHERTKCAECGEFKEVSVESGVTSLFCRGCAAARKNQSSIESHKRRRIAKRKEKKP